MPPKRFFSPRRRENALWASAAETYLRHHRPELSLRERRQTPMMQGVYLHLREWEMGRVLPFPEHPADFAALDPVMRQALLSQAFLGLGTLHLTAVTGGADFYNQDFLPLVLEVDNHFGIRLFSTDDLIGFSSCLFLWQFYYWNRGLSSAELDLLERLGTIVETIFDFTPEEIARFRDFIAAARAELPAVGVFPYRDAPAGYGALSFPANARVILLGDWGTSLDDAEALLEAVWAQVFEAGPETPIVFLHLGDIYYSGLPVECQQNFYDVFVRVRQSLAARFGSSFTQNAANSKIYIIPGNHEYYSEGYGFYGLVDQLAAELETGQQCSFFCLRSDDGAWQFLGMDTGQDDHNAFEPIAEKLKNVLLPILQAAVLAHVAFPFNIWVSRWIGSIVQDLVGPFAPQLRPQELQWHQARIGETGAQTLLLSHHQLFSSVQQIDHQTPQFLNTHLRGDFSSYFLSKIAAWFWGHEHSYALYEDGLFGLNKGRLLGSSSFETSEATDHPYRIAYSKIPFSSAMQQPHQEEGFYDHACAVLDFSQNPGQSVAVTYYGYPSWGQNDPPPAGAQLYTLATETITAVKAGALTPGWSGNATLAPDTSNPNGTYGGNPFQSSNAPAIAASADEKSLLMVWQDSATNQLKWATCEVPAPDSTSLPEWKLQGPLQATSPAGAVSTLASDAAPGLANCGQFFLLVYKSQGGQRLRYATLPIETGKWLDWGLITYGQSQYLSTSAAPGLTAAFEGAYLAFGDAGNSNNLKWLFFEASKNPPNPESSGVWSTPVPIKNSKGNPIPVTGPVVMTANSRTAFVAFRVSGSNNLRLATREMVLVDESTKPPTVKRNPEPTYTVLPALQTVNGNPLQTTVGMALAADDDFLYLIYNTLTGNGTQNFRQAYCPVPGSAAWRNNLPVKVGTYALTPQAPAGLIIGRQMGLLVYPAVVYKHLLQSAL